MPKDMLANMPFNFRIALRLLGGERIVGLEGPKNRIAEKALSMKQVAELVGTNIYRLRKAVKAFK